MRARVSASIFWRCASCSFALRSASTRVCRAASSSRARRSACSFARFSLSLPRALQARDPSLLNGLELDYFEVAEFEPRVLAAAVRVGNTRLIDNVVLEGEPS
jgi:pantothenate synthetase